MKIDKMIARLCLLIVLSFSHMLFADTSPQIGVQRFTLTSLDTISREVVVGNVMAHVPRDFNGEIKLIWTNARYAASTRALRSALIERGVAPERIRLTHDIGGYRAQGKDGVDIHLYQFILRVPECQYGSVNYRFDNFADQGCALNNTRSRSLVNPFQYDF